MEKINLNMLLLICNVDYGIILMWHWRVKHLSERLCYLNRQSADSLLILGAAE